MQYYFQTPMGIFSISTAPYGGYNLKLDDDVINWDNEAKELAKQVFEKTSGFEEWDSSNLTAPAVLEEWNVKI